MDQDAQPLIGSRKSKKADYIFLLRYLKYTWTLRKNFYKNYR